MKKQTIGLKGGICLMFLCLTPFVSSEESTQLENAHFEKEALVVDSSYSLTRVKSNNDFDNNHHIMVRETHKENESKIQPILVDPEDISNGIVNVNIGGTYKLECPLIKRYHLYQSEQNPVSIKWFQNGTLLKNLTWDMRDNSTGLFTIDNVTKESQGNYKCEVCKYNCSFRRRHEFEVYVYVPTHLHSVTCSNDERQTKLGPILIDPDDISDGVVNMNIGGTYKLKCPILSSIFESEENSVSVKWFKHDVLLKNLTWDRRDNSTVLFTVDNVTEDTKGNYKCEVCALVNWRLIQWRYEFEVYVKSIPICKADSFKSSNHKREIKVEPILVDPQHIFDRVVNLEIGGTYKLKCPIRSSTFESEENSISIKWFKNGTLLKKMIWDRRDNSTLLFTIDNVTEDTRGGYACEVCVLVNWRPQNQWRYEFEVYVNESNCEPNGFKCSNERCIKLNYLCDKKPDCADGSDEQGCTRDPRFCDKHSFECEDKAVCIPYSWACDGSRDCKDGSDEAYCDGDYISFPPCDRNEFQCVDKSFCLRWSQVCDHKVQCSDGSDELCSNSTCKGNEFTELCYNNTCRGDQFHCESGGCIPSILVCDGEPHCNDGSDESNNCNKHTTRTGSTIKETTTLATTIIPTLPTVPTLFSILIGPGIFLLGFVIVLVVICLLKRNRTRVVNNNIMLVQWTKKIIVEFQNTAGEEDQLMMPVVKRESTKRKLEATVYHRMVCRCQSMNYPWTSVGSSPGNI
uniref:Low-density lipoprotein receptor 1 n=1 Tax=Cacopsylla melanoneura TaxID=428564 RepID=A0A8D8QBZ7_9HEMI